MGVYEGRGHLTNAMKQLLRYWSDTTRVWNDPMSRKFELEHLVPLEADLKDAVGAMSHMATVLGQIRRDCESDGSL